MGRNYIFSGHDTVNLANTYGTPLYVMSQDIIEKNIDDIVGAFESAGVPYEVNYAGKAFLNKGMCKIIKNKGITLYTIGTVKNIPGIRKYVSVDGGLGDNPRPALYGALYEAVVANKMDNTDKQRVTISGKYCETDTLIPGIDLNKPESGDVLAVFNTGAYNYAMASNYNRLPRPAVVLLKGEDSGILVERETYKDLIKKDRIPGWLN